MTAPVWVPLHAVTTIHDRQVARHGGAQGLRDLGLLENALARPLNAHVYGETAIDALGASYAFGLAKAHAFVDGNKRTAFVTAVTFVRLNGWTFRPSPIDGVHTMEGLAAGEVSETAFAAWLRDGMKRLP